ncbi:MAG: hypothetical protein Ta2A_21980 [Treponemataceae bacterium]|nr:MAG: hypothetical protein Ta2A_21980 [Treponemataceae bacterium]
MSEEKNRTENGTKTGTFFGKIADGIKNFKEKHEAIFQFIMFNLLSNIATITNFVVLNIANAIFKNAGFAEKPFIFYVGAFPFFNYPTESGGFAMFLAFLLSYAAAQTVNFIVQRKLVFNSNNKLGAALPIYIFFILLVYVI